MINAQMRLRLVAVVDFRRGVPTHVQELRSINRWPTLGDRDVVLLISQTRSQLAFVYHDEKVHSSTGGDRVAVAHLRLQLDKSTPWNPLMLKNYAEKVGLDLLGLKKFEEFTTAPATAR